MKRRILSAFLGVVLSITTVLSSLPATTLMVEAAGELDSYVTDQSGLSTETVDAPQKDTTVPNENQYKYQKDELAAFCHFGPNTFNNIEWGNNYGDKTPDQIFGLTNDFDAETLVSSISEAGFKKLIVTAKHHDGFCIWKSQYTDYDIESTQYWKDREAKRAEENSQVYGDVLAEISAACTKYNIDMGLYLSPWDIHEPSYGYFEADGTPITSEEDRINDAKNYNEYYNNQLMEILDNPIYGNNGHFVEIWMDGANGANSGLQYAQEYDFDRWFDTIQTLEGTKDGRYTSDCMLFGAGTKLAVRWIGNEEGHAAETTWSKSKVVNDEYGSLHIFNCSSQTTKKFNDDGTLNTGYYKGDPTGKQYSHGYETGNQWTVPEADAKITSGWFWSESKSTPVSLDTLEDMYFRSVGNGATLLLNVPPNTSGTVDTAILERLKEFGDNIKNSFATNLAASEDATIYASSVYKNNAAYKPGNVVDGDDSTYWTVSEDQKEGSLIVKWAQPKTFDIVSIEEAIQNGQRINHYKVEYKTTDDADWKTMGSGVTIGPKRLVRTAKITATQVKITVGIANVPVANEETPSDPRTQTPESNVTPRIPMLSEIGIYKATEAFEDGIALPDGVDMIQCNDGKITYKGNWHPQTGPQYLNGQNTYSSSQNASFEFKFTGSKIYLRGTKDNGHGSADIYIDGTLVDTINTKRPAGQRSTGTLIFESEDLEHKEHTIKLVAKTSAAIGFEAAYVINNDGRGLLEIEKEAYTTNEGCDVAVKVKRVGGSKGELSAVLFSDVGSAIQRNFDTELTTTLNFADGETEKYIPRAAYAKRTEVADGDVYFYIKLSGQAIGFNDSAKVTIKDAESITIDSLNACITECASYSEGVYRGDWAAFTAALQNAKAVQANTNATTEEIKLAYIALDEAAAALTLLENYTTSDPFEFPSEVNKTIVLEAEMGTIVNNTEGDSGWPMQVAEKTWASGGKIVDAMKNKDSLKIPYHAAEAGTYELTITYRSGDNNNGFAWVSDPEGKIQAGDVVAGASDSAGATHTKTFEMILSEAGDGVLVFNAGSDGAPQLDKFDVKLIKATVTFDELKELIQGIDLAGYEGVKTPESLQALKDAIEEAKALYADETAIALATQTKVKAANDKIKAALESLEDIPEPTPEPTPNPTPEPTPNPTPDNTTKKDDAKPSEVHPAPTTSSGNTSSGSSSAASTSNGTGAKTGDAANVGMMMALCLAAAVMGIIVKTERRKAK